MGHATLYLPDKELKRSRDFYEKFFSNKKNVANLGRMINRGINDYSKILWKAEKIRLADLSNEQLWHWFKKFEEIFNQLIVLFTVIDEYNFSNFEEKIMGELKELADDPEKVFLVLTEYKKKIISNENSYIFKQTLMEVADNLSDKIDFSDLKNLFHEENNDIAEKKWLIKQLKLTGWVLSGVETLALVKYWRYKLRLTYMPAVVYLDFLMIMVFGRLGLIPLDGYYYFSEEIERIIFQKSPKLTVQELKRRKNGYFVVYEAGKTQVFWGQEARKKRDSLIKEKQTGGREINGMLVFPGNVRGKVLLLSYTRPENHAKKIKQMKGGEIIVTEMTRPNLLPALKKASAVITDEGGITCHAAIICRELKIPGLVGTKTATEIFKDGDIIELDGNNATARIIK
ncbi:TPA: hypothetical protein DF272_04405 [Candidatus Falkowbacteria bacterium]|nr:hypothetical protein [Candidatus Falkowbacteria bacterium]